MRPLILASLLVAAACDGGGTGPEATAITVRVHDDRGVPVVRTQVIVTTAASRRLDAHTRGDGTVDFGVADAGVYRVWVIPRAGYVGGTDSLSRSVTVGANARVTLDFTVHREGAEPSDPLVIW